MNVRRGSTAGRSARTPGVRSRADWRDLLSLAVRCVGDVDAEERGDEARLRRMTMANRIHGASAEMFDRDAGAATADVARAFLRIGAAFARKETPEVTRRELARLVREGAEFLDQRMTQLATDDFKRAHAGRPEVWR